MSNAAINNTAINNPETTAEIFRDPVEYLARLGIEAEVVAETVMPAAA